MNQQQDHAWLRDVRDALSAADLVEPPHWVLERARRLFETHVPRSAPTLVERVRASLIFDSRKQRMAAAGVRGANVAEGPWQLLYRGGDVDVDLFVRPNHDGRTINVRGQALSLAGAHLGSGVVEALRADEPPRSHGLTSASVRSEMEASGEFALQNLERGRYDVMLRFGPHEIELSDV